MEGLYQCLVGAGFAPWLDREHIIPGMRWQSMIKKALKESDFVLVCLSASSINKRGFLQREIKQALEQAEEKLEHDVYLIPARLDDCEVPDALSDIQWVDLFENDGCQRLLKAIKYGLKQSGKTMPSPVSSSRRWWRLFIGVGGALMLVTLVGWLYIPPSGQRPLDEQTVASPSPKTEMVNPTPSATPITTELVASFEN